MRQRILSMLLVAVLTLTSVDITVYAQEVNNADVEETIGNVEDEEVEETEESIQEPTTEEPVVEETAGPVQELTLKTENTELEKETGFSEIIVRPIITKRTVLTEIVPGVYKKEIQNVSDDLQMTSEEEQLPQLEKPTNLKWSTERPGDICWDAVEGAEGCYDINIYKDGEYHQSIGTINWSGSSLTYSAGEDILESGTYTFEICAEGREGVSANSEYAVCSEAFVYVRPEKELGITSKLWWDEKVKTKGCWEPVTDSDGYSVDLFKDHNIAHGYVISNHEVDFVHAMTKAGRYSFTVRALSADITKIANGKESEESPVYNTTQTTEEVDNTLKEALEQAEDDPEAAVEQIKNLDIADLAVAMQTDDSILDRMQELEEIYAESKGIEVITEVSEEIENLIDTSMISMTGVALNAAENTTDMTMSFSMPEEGNGILIDGWQYRNTVQFNIDLNGEVYTDKLSVPIRITVPVPTGLPQDRLEILHYHRDGSYELVPLTFNYDGTVSFTVTSLSPFVFTEKVTPITGIFASESQVTLRKAGDTMNVLLGLEPYEASSHMLKAESADEAVITVELNDSMYETYGIINLSITATGKGGTVVKLSTLDGKVTHELPVKVMGNGDEKEKGEFWVELPEGDDFAYTGKQIKPQINVYDGTVLLQEKKDYTVTYQNNIKVKMASAKKNVPTITVTGKGNYTGTETIKFSIYNTYMTSPNISVADITVAYNKKVQKVVPTVYGYGKKLKINQDFTVSYPDLATNSKAYKAPGIYTILIEGKGGYTGTREVKLTITESKLMSKVTVSKIATQPYTGAAVTTATMAKAPTVKYGDKKLKEGTHYTVSYENNVNIGTATMTLTGTDTETSEGTFTGTKKVSFKIGGASLSKAQVTGVPESMTYTGTEINEQTENWGNPIKVLLNGNELIRAADAESEGDYIVTLKNNIKKGTATVTIKGVNAYSGSIKKEFVINAYNINDNAKMNLVTEEMDTNTVYAKGGSKPEPVIKFGETTLVKGMDYTLTYANNTKLYDGTSTSKRPTVTITGKGNFKGTVKIPYTIAKQDIGNMKISAADVVYKKEKGAYKATPVVKDLDNKTLKNKTDFTVTSYTYGQDVTLKNGIERKAGETVGKNDIVPAGTLLKVAVTGKGNYTDDNPLVAEYRVVKSSIAKATVTVPSQPYTGKSITIEDKNKIKVKVGKTRLDPEDFEIVDGSFKNNTKAGTASFTIRGVGNYGGTKKVTFKIKPKGLIWWWR